MRSCSQVAWGRCDKTLVHNGQLEEVLGQGAGLEIVIISLADTSQEAHWPRPAKLELQHTKHETLCLQNFLGGVAIINHIDNLLK